MSKYLGIVCVVACFGIGCGDDDVMPGNDAGPVTVDSGPVTVDSGPIEVDAGPIEVDAGPVDAGPISCDYDGTYGVTSVEGNPTICDMAAIESCTLLTTDGVPTVTCTLESGDEAMGECTYDADCVCTGETTVDFNGTAIDVVIAGDFPNMTLTATALTMDCDFTLTAM